MDKGEMGAEAPRGGIRAQINSLHTPMVVFPYDGFRTEVLILSKITNFSLLKHSAGHCSTQT